MYTQAEVDGRKKTAMTAMPLKETNQLKSNCSARKQYSYTLHGTLSPPSLTMAMCLCTESMHKTTETTDANMRYPKSLNPSPTVASTSAAKREPMYDYSSLTHAHNLHQ